MPESKVCQRQVNGAAVGNEPVTLIEDIGASAMENLHCFIHVTPCFEPATPASTSSRPWALFRPSASSPITFLKSVAEPWRKWTLKQRGVTKRKPERETAVIAIFYFLLCDKFRRVRLKIATVRNVIQSFFWDCLAQTVPARNRQEV